MIKKCLVVFLIISFLVLAYKNPFDTKSLVPNLEPYPDSIFYSYPAWSLLKGTDWGMNLDNISIRNIVPPSYGLFLIPFFAIFNDVRAFYFANIVLGVISIIFFFLIIEKLFKNQFIAFILSGVLVSSYYFYSLPQFLMAENMVLTVFLIMFWILLQPVSFKRMFNFSILNSIFLLIKLSNVPVFASFSLLYLLKILREKNTSILKNFFVVSTVVYGLTIGEIFFSGILKGREGFVGLVNFSLSNFKNNFIYYLEAISGFNGQFIWMSEKFITLDLIILSVVGIIMALFERKNVLIVNTIFILFVPLFLFMCLFYYQDTRYIYLIYPLILIFIGFVLDFFKSSKFLYVFMICFAFCDLGFMSIKTNFEPRLITLKKQVGLNFRHAEEPWNYLAIQNFNKYFSQNTSKKYLATFLPIYYLNYFKNDNYIYLPISLNQEFPEYLAKMCPLGVDVCYQKILDQQGKIYLSDYYLSNNLGVWGKELDKIKVKYKLNKVADGCWNSCAIYELELREAK